jgi:hypothetical protein
MSQSTYIATVERQRNHPSRQGSESSTGSPRTVGNTSAPRAPYAEDAREPRLREAGDAEVDIELSNLNQRGVRQRHSIAQQPVSAAETRDQSLNESPDTARPIYAGRDWAQASGLDHNVRQRDVQMGGRPEDVRSEMTNLDRRDLGMFDVAALILNKQIGTGIFTTPGLVLSLTGNKTISVIMWFFGGVWAFLR